MENKSQELCKVASCGVWSPPGANWECLGAEWGRGTKQLFVVKVVGDHLSVEQ